MELYFAPMTCSLASRIALYEAGVDATFKQVDRFSKKLSAGGDYREVYALGMVPALRLDDGSLLTETAAILQFIAGLRPDAEPAPTEAERRDLHRWLSYVGGELHKVIFYPLFHPDSSDEVKRHACALATARLRYVDQHLAERAYLLERISVADAYLFTVLSWMVATPLRLDDYPNAKAYHRRLMQRPSYARAVGDERPLLQAS